MIRTLIVDDEPLALDILETYIGQVPDMELVGKCHNAIDANSILQKEKVDLLLLDIQMPQLSGIDFIRTVQNPPLLIFTTAYPEFAVQGFELNAVDYLLKPISFDRFLKAINKVSEKLQDPSFLVESNADFIFVKSDKKLVKLFFNDILYIEGLKDYVIIHTDAGRIITLQTMKSLEEKLPNPVFLRCHRSFIVNINRLHAIAGQAIEIMEKGQLKFIPIGKNYSESVEQLIAAKRL